MAKREGEKDHKVRMAVGNGVRSDVWKEFLARFGNIKMCELYGATEGNICFMNHTGKIGSVGRTGFFYKLAFPFELIKYDIQKDEPTKNKHGWCESVKKVLASVKRRDHRRWLQSLRDDVTHRLSRAFIVCCPFSTLKLAMGRKPKQLHNRWKGENVATTEVSDIIGMLDFIQEANVYGVSVSGHEGKVGMASIILKPDQSLNLKRIFEHCTAYLPAYAFPRFLRLQENMEVTGTFKQQKFRLVEQGFDPSAISDPLYFLDDSKQSYLPMTKDIYDKITNGLLKL
ncbi:hypothetical protein AB205_0022630 [Aquarana catesbeiana]|uniref:long-chain-fatty-acid--CoA ligase n=1 Tax=Aquarana catesbeiana TaxID=8400 RepID=A0A2G9S3M9_AQUCT|nr:hypothetical protein AB205_0022630 [Aquarana catesbeiana]